MKNKQGSESILVEKILGVGGGTPELVETGTFTETTSTGLGEAEKHRSGENEQYSENVPVDKMLAEGGTPEWMGTLK